MLTSGSKILIIKTSGSIFDLSQVYDKKQKQKQMKGVSGNCGKAKRYGEVGNEVTRLESSQKYSLENSNKI